MVDLEGKVALVTGAASGLGRACAQSLAAHGARVVATDVNEIEGREVAETIGRHCDFLALDVTSEEAWAEVINAVLARYDRLDILVNNAGIGFLGSVEDTSLEDWQRVQRINVDGVFLGCKAAIPAMRKGGYGSIINMSSIAGLRGMSQLAAYNASKGAVRLLTKSVALSCAERGDNIRCNSLHPSFIDTPMVAEMVAASPSPDKMAHLVQRTSPMNRMGRPEEVALTVVFLASEASSFINGVELPVDGGTMAR